VSIKNYGLSKFPLMPLVALYGFRLVSGLCHVFQANAIPRSRSYHTHTHTHTHTLQQTLYTTWPVYIAGFSFAYYPIKPQYLAMF